MTEVKTETMALLAAAEKNDFEEVKRQFALGGDPAYEHYVEGTWGAEKRTSALHEALHHKNIEMAKFLLDHKARPAALRSDYDWRGCGSKETAFQVAAEDTDMLLLFLQYPGADPNLVSRSDTHSMRTDGHTTYSLIHTATRKNCWKSVDALVNAGAKIDSMYVSVYHNERGYNSNTNMNVLHIAAKGKCIEAARRLLQHPDATKIIDQLMSELLQEPNPKRREDDDNDDPRSGNYVSPIVCVKRQLTPLQVAIINHDQPMVDLLISHGADPSINGLKGSTTISTTALATENDIILVQPIAKAAAKRI